MTRSDGETRPLSNADSSSELVRRIPRLDELCPEQVVALGAPETDDSNAVLFDQWGRHFPVARSFSLGREPAPPGLALLESSVSRQHARLAYGESGWTITDDNSTNGTYVDGRRIQGATELARVQLIVCGDVGLVFLADASVAAIENVTDSIRRTSEHMSLGEQVMRLAETSAGSGGVATLAGVSVKFGATQFALLRVLAERALAEAELPEETRGFVRSVELMKILPWESVNPQDNHVKQLVRRTRRAFDTAPVDAVIEARQGFGYRLAVSPLLASP